MADFEDFKINLSPISVKAENLPFVGSARREFLEVSEARGEQVKKAIEGFINENGLQDQINPARNAITHFRSFAFLLISCTEELAERLKKAEIENIGDIELSIMGVPIIVDLFSHPDDPAV